MLAPCKRRAASRPATLRWLATIALALPACAAQAQAVKSYAYAPDTIYSVHTAPGLATQIEISPSEQVKDFGTGFSSNWDLVRRDNVFYIKPKSPQADTNMYIRTSQRSYLFDLKVIGKRWRTLQEARAAGVHYRVRFSYPGASTAANVSADNAHADAGATQAPEPSSRYDYAASAGSEWLRPARVHDDGRLTYIQLPPGLQIHGGVPAVFGRKTADGEDFIVNSSYRKQQITVHGVYRYLVLRHGDSVLALRRSEP
ncbi:MAG: TrbG/VirB9 family P-type conjugative transfer protein [Brachymonas denitrificans]|uniref:TrbG/VirB9 family P-type conjugative transfer protein n=1 Tax=Brachymonas denitrificans TaxID=28220 RepID=UPI001BD07F9B|nr:TrbG/VirB9 family P-type conjugative transfer protein [Brachymonas denitrificans]